jgi:hypothetical protein
MYTQTMYVRWTYTEISTFKWVDIGETPIPNLHLDYITIWSLGVMDA